MVGRSLSKGRDNVFFLPMRKGSLPWRRGLAGASACTAADAGVSDTESRVMNPRAPAAAMATAPTSNSHGRFDGAGIAGCGRLGRASTSGCDGEGSRRTGRNDALGIAPANDRSVSRASARSLSRSSGALVRHRPISARNSGGSIVISSVGARCKMPTTTVPTFSPANGRWPVSVSYITTPNDQASVAGPSARTPLICSGLM